MHCHTGWLAWATVQWYKRQNQKHLQLVYVVTHYNHPSGRFSGEINDKSTIYTLIISGVQANDSGVYYCATKEYSTAPFKFGNGSKLLITGSPIIYLLTLPPEDISGMKIIPLVCLVKKVDPDSFTVLWNVSGHITGAQTDSGIIGSDGTYTIRSLIILPAEIWGSGALCKCVVQINSSVNLLSESVSSQSGIDYSPCFTGCIFLLSGSLCALLLLLMVVLTGRRRCRNRQTGNRKRGEELKDSRAGAQENATIYARLVVNADSAL
ncbi:immunoglobulin lambda-1 light chain-like [Scyliorhinus torazame]